jgi:transcriptional antiterminator NusG
MADKKKENQKKDQVEDKSQIEEEKEESETESKKNKIEPSENVRWYIINSYSSHEKKVANLIEQRVKANNLEKYVPKVVVPTQEKIVVKKGEKQTVEERLFPGYILVQMDIDHDESWRIVRTTEGVTGFVGNSKKPSPLSEKEVNGIMKFMDVKQPAYKPSFSVGDAVKVLDGPFKDFVGSISEINEDKGQVKVLLSVFGRETPIVLDFLQVNKL